MTRIEEPAAFFKADRNLPKAIKNLWKSVSRRAETTPQRVPGSASWSRKINLDIAP
jgi:hypothetical protein